MAIEMLYFAWVREAIGRDSERVDVPVGVTSIADLLDRLAADSEDHARAFADRSRLRAALDQEFVSLDRSIGQARELAVFPPVTGG